MRADLPRAGGARRPRRPRQTAGAEKVLQILNELRCEWEQADVIEEDDAQGEDEEANRGLRSWQRERE